MALPSDWKEQMQGLSPADLRAELEREETLLGEHYQSLYDADQQLEDTEQQLAEEAQREEARLYLDRQATIRRLERSMRDRQKRMDTLSEEAHKYERRALDPYTSLTYKIISLEVAASLWRSVKAYKGRQTRQRRSLATYRGWQTKKASTVERLLQVTKERDRWRREAEQIAARIKEEEARIAYKKSIIPKVTLSRVTIALYLIIQEGEHTYPRGEGKYYVYHRPHYRKARHQVRYPKGRFQSILQCDSFIDLGTGELRTDIDPFKTLENTMRSEVSSEFIEEFSLKTMNPDDLTLGIVNIIPDEAELGKAPFKISISRTDETTGREWKTMINRYIMTDAEYYDLTRNMKEYLDALEALG